MRRRRFTGSSVRFLRLVSLAFMALSGLVQLSCTRPSGDGNSVIAFGLWGTHEQQRSWEAVIDEFERQYPDVKVNVLPMGYSGYFQEMQAMMVGDVAPDVIMIGVNYYDEWLHRGVLADLTAEFQDLLEMGEMLPIPRQAVEREGRVYGLPLNVTGVVTCVNVDALAAAGIALPDDGWSWQEIVEMAPRISARHGDPDAATDYALVFPHPIIFFWQEGLDLFDDAYAPTRVTINSAKAAKVLDAMRELHGSGYVVPPEVGLDQGYRELFRDGRVAFYFDSLIGTLMFYNRTSFDWDVRAFPAGSVSNVSNMGSVTVGVWSKSRNQEAARKLARFLASPESSKVAMQNQRFLPPYREITNGREFLSMQPPPSMQHFTTMMEEGAARPLVYGPGLAGIERIFLDRMTQAFSRDDLSSPEILAGLEEDLNRWLRKMRRRGFYGAADTPRDSGDQAARDILTEIQP